MQAALAQPCSLLFYNHDYKMVYNTAGVSGISFVIKNHHGCIRNSGVLPSTVLDTIYFGLPLNGEQLFMEITGCANTGSSFQLYDHENYWLTSATDFCDTTYTFNAHDDCGNLVPPFNPSLATNHSNPSNGSSLCITEPGGLGHMFTNNYQHCYNAGADTHGSWWFTNASIVSQTTATNSWSTCTEYWDTLFITPDSAGPVQALYHVNETGLDCFQDYYYNFTAVATTPSQFTTANFGYTVSNDTVYFVDSTVNATAFQWDFGNGFVSGPAEPEQWFYPGYYTVCQVAQSTCDADTICKPINVSCNTYLPTADFGVTISNDSVFLADSSINADTWHWDFGDGDTSTVQNPVHHYDSNGAFVIQLIITNTCLHADTLLDTITIDCQTPVSAGFSIAHNSLEITATNTSTASYQWMWDFGDSATSMLENPTHLFADSGTYEVCLTALGICPFQDSLCDTIQVMCSSTVPTAGYVVDSVISDSFYLTSTSTLATLWSWDIGSGQISTQENPIIVFPSYDTFNLCLTAIASPGCFADTFCSVQSNLDSVMLTGPMVSTSKISDLAGNFQGTLQNSSYFGRAVAGIPDINGDGIPDLAVGEGKGPTNKGAVWILEMDTNGQVADEWVITNGYNGFNGDPNMSGFGRSIASLGDWNNDGFADLAVTAPGNSNDPSLYILYLDSSGVIGEESFSTQNGLPMEATSVGNLGDIDGNGYEDLFIGHDPAVEAYILLMDSGPSISSNVLIDAATFNYQISIGMGSEFGTSIANIGDVNGDGFTDIAIGFPIGFDWPYFGGVVLVTFLDSTGAVIDWQFISRAQGNLNRNLDSWGFFGKALAAPGDLNGDGIPDLLVGTSKGVFFVIYLNSDGTVLSSQRIGQNEGGAGPLVNSNGRFGEALGILADATGDCLPEFVVGTPRDDDGGSWWSRRGAVYVMDVNTTVPAGSISAGFTASDTITCTGVNVQFTDTSASTSRTWLFPGGTPATSTLISQPVSYDSTGSYSVTLITSDCQSTDTVTFVNFIDVIGYSVASGFLGADTTICEGDTLVLEADSAFTTYAWSNGSTDSTLAVADLGTYALTITDICGTFVDSIEIDVDLLPTPNLGPDQTLCVGDSLVLDVAHPAATYMWQDSSTNPTFTVTQADTIYVISTDMCGSGADTVIITYDSIPAPDLGPDTIICPGNSITLSATHPGGTYSWQDGSSDSTLNVSQAGLYQVTVTGGCPVLGTDEILVLVDSIPNPQLGNDSTLCLGASLVLDVFQPNATYVWQDSSTDSTFAVTQADSIYVTSTNSCGFGTDTVIISYDSIPAPNLGMDTIICPGNAITLTALHTGATYLWQDGTTDSSLVVNQAGLYSITVTGGCVVTGVDSIQVLVDSIPAPNLGNDSTLCVGGSMTLDVYQAGVTYLWQDGSTDSVFTVNQADTIYVTSTNSCGIGTDTTIITYDSIPAPNLGPDTILCPGDSLVLNGFFPGGTYLWQDNTTDSTLVVTQAGTYAVTVSGGCVTPGSDVVVVLYDSVPAPLLPDTLDNCQGNPITLTNPHPGADYLWSTGATTAAISALVSGTYSVTVSNACGIAIDSVVAIIDSVPVVNLPSSVIFCIGDSVLLDASFPGANYSWSTGASTSSITISQPGVYSVTVSNYCGTVTATTLGFISFPTPDLGPDTAICLGDSLVLDAGGPNINSYSWSTGGSGQLETVSAPNTVSVQVTDVFGCGGSDTIEIGISSVIRGTILQGSNLQPLSNTLVLLVDLNPLDSSVVALDTTITDVTGYYEFWTDSVISYVKALPDSSVYPNELLTYFNGALSFVAADSIANPNCDSITADFLTVAGSNPGGPGFIAGLLSQGAGKTTGVGEPVPDVTMMLVNSGFVYAWTNTDSEGKFQFENLPLADYQVWCDYKLIDNGKAPTISLTAENSVIDYVHIKAHMDSLSIFLATEAKPLLPQLVREPLLYPNPSSGTFTLRLELAEQHQLELRLVDALSKTLAIRKLQGVVGQNEVHFDQQTLSSGIYFLSVQIDGQHEAFLKVVVE